MTARAKPPKDEHARARAWGHDAAVGARIRAVRQAMGVSQQALAAALGVSFQMVQKTEKGTNRVSAGRLLLAAEALGVGPLDLLGVESDVSGLLERIDVRMAVRLASLTWEQKRAVEAVLDAFDGGGYRHPTSTPK